MSFHGAGGDVQEIVDFLGRHVYTQQGAEFQLGWRQLGTTLKDLPDKSGMECVELLFEKRPFSFCWIFSIVECIASDVPGEWMIQEFDLWWEWRSAAHCC